MPLTRSSRDIKKNKLFSGVKDYVLNSFFDQKEIKEAREGEIIYKTGDESNAIYLIIKGEVKIKFSANSYVISRIYNDFFGEKEIVDDTKRISTALAFSKLIYYRIDKTLYNKLISQNPIVAENLRKFGEIKLPELPSDLAKKSKIFERDKPISFKVFSNKNDLEEEQQNEKEPPPVMTQQLLPDLESLDVSLEDEDITIEENFEIETELEELEEVVEENTDDVEKSVEIVENTPKTVEELPQLPDELKEKQKFNNLHQEKVISHIEASEPGINREVIRKIFLSLNRIFSGISISELITNTRKALKDLTNSESIDLILVEEKLATMEKIISPGGKTRSEYFQLSDGLTGSCALEKKPLNYDRPTEDNRFNSKVDQPGAARLKRILFFPVINDAGETVAVIQSARENKKYTEEEISYLTMISKQMDTAISRTKTLEKLIKEEKLNLGKKISNIITGEISIPISIIDSYTKILSQKKLPSDTDDIIRMLQKQAASVEEITDSIFKAMSEDIVLEKNKIHFNEFIDDVLELLSEYCETRETKLFKKIGDGAVVDIDRSKLYTAIFQFIKNCVDDSKQPGKIYFSTELTGDAISITIQNEGIGHLVFPEGNVIDYFYSKSKIKEDEVGLLMAKKIIGAHSGEVSLESTKGVSSTFRIKIPVAPI